MKLVRPLLLIAGCLALAACSAAPAETPTPDPVAVQTRIARELAGIPTAAPAPGRTPLASPTPAPDRPPTGATELPSTPTTIRQDLGPAREYTVQTGDTLSSIAARFNTSMAAIQLLNNLNDSQVVRAGQTLKLPTGQLHPEESPWWFIYIVQPGETLSNIAAKFRVPLPDLLRVNEVANPGLVRAGQRLIIPARGPRAT